MNSRWRDFFLCYHRLPPNKRDKTPPGQQLGFQWMEGKLAMKHQDQLPWKIHFKGMKPPLIDSEVCFSHPEIRSYPYSSHTDTKAKPFKVHLERGRAAVEPCREKLCSESRQAEPDVSIQANSPINPVPCRSLILQHIQSTGLERRTWHFSHLFWPSMRKASMKKSSRTSGNEKGQEEAQT